MQYPLHSHTRTFPHAQLSISGYFSVRQGNTQSTQHKLRAWAGGLFYWGEVKFCIIQISSFPLPIWKFPIRGYLGCKVLCVHLSLHWSVYLGTSQYNNKKTFPEKPRIMTETCLKITSNNLYRLLKCNYKGDQQMCLLDANLWKVSLHISLERRKHQSEHAGVIFPK